jgi:hypothetical protein
MDVTLLSDRFNFPFLFHNLIKTLLVNVLEIFSCKSIHVLYYKLWKEILILNGRLLEELALTERFTTDSKM